MADCCNGNCNQGRTCVLRDTQAGEGFEDTQPMSDDLGPLTADEWHGVLMVLLWPLGLVAAIMAGFLVVVS